jgi:hypothetical protein
MASTPAFASTPRLGVAAVSGANTNFDGTGTIVDILTGVTAGTRIERVVIQTTGNPADSMMTLFIHNGTSYFLFDVVDMGDPAAQSTTVAGFRWERKYNDLVLPSSSHKFAAAITVALTAGVMNVFAFGADLT